MNYQHGFLFRINGTESLPPSLCAPAYLPTSFYTLIKTLHIQLKQLIQSLEKGGWFKIENAYGDQIFALSHFRSENSKGTLIKFMPSLRGKVIFQLPFL